MNDNTPSVQYTKRAKSWEQQAVDEIISLEAREDYLIREIQYLEHVQFENGFFDTYSEWIDDRIEDLQYELEDTQNALGK